MTRVLTTHSTDELFVLLQILGKYWRARAAHAPDDDITIDEWVPGTRQNRWHRALCRRCERARALLQHEPRSEAWPSTVANVLAPMGKPSHESDMEHALFLRECADVALKAAKAAAVPYVHAHTMPMELPAKMAWLNQIDTALDEALRAFRDEHPNSSWTYTQDAVLLYQ